MTETESMVVRVAKAIYDAENGLDGDCVGDMIYEDFRIDGPVDNAMKETMIVCKMAARAAIEAMKTPTPEMVRAALDELPLNNRIETPEGRVSMGTITDTEFELAWQSAFVKALEG